MQSLFVLGRQPALGIAELESLFGAEHVAPFGERYVLCDIPAHEIPFARLGGSVKLCRIVDTVEASGWPLLEKKLLTTVPSEAEKLAEGKLHLGLSAYEVNVHVKDLAATALRLKKVLRAATDQSVRVVPNNEPALSTAQVLHNKLTTNQGMEVVLIKHGSKVHIARTVAEQDITAYAKRDQNRPKRDARVGMLPPKLAQIIINLAGRHVLPESAKIVPNPEPKNAVVLDPFCGTGVILQEAALMGYSVYGTDIEPRMIEYSATNLQWLNETHKLVPLDVDLQIGDATNHRWNEPFDIVACEGYLGQPFSAFPSDAKLREVTQTCNQIAKGFLKNIAEQIESGTRLCIALPAWQRPNGTFEHLKLLDQISDLGYNRVDLTHVRTEDLLYYRPDQVVARELLVITRK